jgi:glyoxylase-like metal-dependent hydrolase (beta-lactamase superfamily II)
MTQPPGPFTAVAEHVYVALVPFPAEDGPAEVTVGLVVGSEAAVLVDCGATPQQGRWLRTEVAAVTPVPLAGVVLTHWHYDHSFGLAGLGAPISVAHESVGDRLHSPLALAEASRLGVDPAELIRPDREAIFEQRGRVAAVSGEISRLAGLAVPVEEAEARGTWALPFAAVRDGLETALTQARATDPQRRLPLA